MFYCIIVLCILVINHVKIRFSFLEFFRYYDKSENETNQKKKKTILFTDEIWGSIQYGSRTLILFIYLFHT